METFLAVAVRGMGRSVAFLLSGTLLAALVGEEMFLAVVHCFYLYEHYREHSLDRESSPGILQDIEAAFRLSSSFSF